MKNNKYIGAGISLKLDDIDAVARKKVGVLMSPITPSSMKKSLETLTKFTNGRTPIYGLNTQFGSQVNILDTNLISNDEDYFDSLKTRQLNLVRSHNTGLGEEVNEDIVRATMFLRAHCIGLGHSGVRTDVVESLLSFLNNGVCPIVHKYGSIGASGDLIPLSAIASALIGDSEELMYKKRKIKTNNMFKETGMKRLKLEVREGLALMNGTSFMTASAALSLYDLRRLFNQMLSAIAMSLESLSIIDSAYHPLVHELKNHRGEKEVNAFIINFWKGTKLVRSLTDLRNEKLESFKLKKEHFDLNKNLQDYYSLRSVPQGFGAFKENLDRAVNWIEEEINSVNDNPVISAKNQQIYHCSNFMGYYVTEACDILKMDISQASTWIHAILSILYHPRKNFGLPANLVEHPEIYNGFRPVHILSAAIAVQNRKLAQSQQAFMLPTEGDNQDVNSLAVHAAQDLGESLKNLERLVSILLISSAQALELRGLKKGSKKSQKIIKVIRSVSPFLKEDRPLNLDIERVIELMKRSEI
jgi:phenylalanine ammonia-lyase